MDMDQRMSKRSVRFGEKSDSKSYAHQEQMDDDSEAPSLSEMDASYDELRPIGGESPGSAFESEYDPRLE